MAEKTVKQVTVKFVVESKVAGDLYIVGSTKNLGAWVVSKAAALKADGMYTVSKKFNEGEEVEFKVVKDKTFDQVELGMFNEEIVNHSFVASKGLVVELVVYNFKG